MKTLRNILHIVLAALLLASCVREELVPPTDPAEMGDQVTIDGSFDVPIAMDHPWTKSMQEVPGIQRLFVAVFDESDMMTEIKEAFPGTKDNPSDHFEPAGSGSNYLTHFHVTLTRVEAGTRYVEFIAVSDASKNDLLRANRRSESGMALTEAMKISNNEEAFFGRRTFLYLTEATDMTGIKLIRNYAKVTLDVSGATAPTGKSIVFTGFKVFNVPKTGTIAPFNSNSPELATIVKDNVPIEISNPDCFAHYDLLGGANPYDDMTNGFTATVGTSTIDIPPYTGFMNGAVEFEDFSSLYNSSGNTDASFPFLTTSGEDFLYECPFRESDENPFIILKAEWTEGGSTTTCYYKADFVYKKDGVNTYYNILRNFQFTLSIGSVAEKGASTIYEAVNSIAMNNFESSTMASTLTNISNGNERLYISATDRLLTTGRIDTVYLRNSVFSGGEWSWDTDASDNYGVSHTFKRSNLVGRSTDLITSVVFDGVVGSSDSDKEWQGWTRVIVNFADPWELNLRKGMVWKQSLVFYNTSDPALSRTCVFTRRRPFELFLDVQDYVAAVEGQSCRVDIKIPAGLTEARFPLEFYIEQEKNTLYPDATSGILLPVNTGKTQIPGRSGNNYYFTRIITWQEYSTTLASVDGYRTFPSYFKTLVAQSATTLWVMPASADGHFTIQDDVLDVFTNTDSFLNEKVAGSVSFEYSSLVVKAGDELDDSVESRTNEATAISGAEITYTSSDPSVATVSSKGVVTGHAVGTATITASCDAHGAYNAASASYTVTVVASDKKLPGLVVNWTRNPITIYKTGASDTQVAIYAVSENHSTGAITISYTSSNTSVASIVGPVGGLYYVHPGSAGTATITATASIAADGDFVADSRVLTYQVTVTSGFAESGAVFHSETFLGRNPEQPTTLQTDYESKWQSVTPATATFHSQSSVWHQHPSGDYGAYAIGWHDQSTNSVWADTESWLVSPEIDLAASQSAKLTFSHAAAYHLYPAQMKDSGFARVMLILASDYDGSAGTPGDKWVDISPDARQYPFPDYKYVPAAIDLTPYAGKKIRIAFKYSSSSDASHAMNSDNPNCSWEVKNVVIREN